MELVLVPTKFTDRGVPPSRVTDGNQNLFTQKHRFFLSFFYGFWVYGLGRYSAPPLYRNFVLEKILRIWRVPPSPLFRTDSVKRFLTPSLTS